MNLKDLARAAATIEPNHSILLYGQPKTGKTRLVGTAATLKEINKIYWFDLENGVQTLLSMGLTDEELEKVIVIKIADSRDTPIGIETMLKALTSKTPINICEAHGKVNCAECIKNGQPSISFCLSQCTHHDLVVIDSGSQLGDSALAAACLSKPDMFKPTYDEYGMVNKWMGDCLSVIQQCKTTNFIVITHEIALEDDEGKDKFFPLIGSKPFSMKSAKYFGTVIYVHKKLNKHVAGSSSTYRGDLLTGSRVGASIETSKEGLTMRAILVEGGILKAGVLPPAAPVSAPVAPTPSPVSANPQPLSLKERLSIKKP